jgi:hypothetical protein
VNILLRLTLWRWSVSEEIANQINHIIHGNILITGGISSQKRLGRRTILE